jgi:hypothetical protein
MRSINFLLCALLLSGCAGAINSMTVVPVKSAPTTAYPDATTPNGMNEFNGGILDDIDIDGRPYNVMTPGAAAAVEKWQKSRAGFVVITSKTHITWATSTTPAKARITYRGLTAIDKGIIFKWDTTSQ